ncbi:MAG: phosphogluconate dehydrogenase [Anaerolineaceae bacterium]|nr:phosphogluconate dehydrogenase [Anaerolineaceae bacterium]
MSRTIGILHPGAMGVSVAASAKNSGNTVYWAGEGRSATTHQRAEDVGLVDAGSLADLCQQCEVILSVCPPAAAEQVAQDVIATEFSGLYLDANAIAPQRAERIGQAMAEAGITFVDGGIIGGPAWEPGRTWLYLSGQSAPEIAACFASGPLETSIVSEQIGQASALKMVFAAYSKGTTALLAAIVATAESLGVREALNAQWSRGGSTFAEETEQRVRRVTAKAWRFEGEMHEIAATLAGAGLPDGFHLAAAEVYSRMADFKDAPETPELAAVLQALLESD